MARTPALRAALFLTAISLAMLQLALVWAPKAGAADRIYWTEVGGGGFIHGAPLAGGGSVDTLYSFGAGGPFGLALDAAAARIYWTDTFVSALRGAPLAGGGTVDTLYSGAGPVGLAVDPAASRLYWADFTGNAIRGAPLAGGGAIDDLYSGAAQGVSDPRGIAVDVTGARVYWVNGGDDTIRGAPLAGGGTVDTLYGSATGVDGAYGIAVDPAAGRIYWANNGDSTVRGAPLAGGGTVDTLYNAAQGANGPIGLAVDPAAARIYWTNGGGGAIRGAPLAGGGTVDTLYGGTQLGMVAVLRSPAGTSPPAISGGGQLGQQLNCSQGTWASDFAASFVYRVPQTLALQWLKNGADIGGATANIFTPTEGGSYSCRVTASNLAGDTSQTSSAISVPGPKAASKCKRLRKKLKRQKRKLARARSDAKRSAIGKNIADTRARLRKHGC